MGEVPLYTESTGWPAAPASGSVTSKVRTKPARPKVCTRHVRKPEQSPHIYATRDLVTTIPQGNSALTSLNRHSQFERPSGAHSSECTHRLARGTWIIVQVYWGTSLT